MKAVTAAAIAVVSAAAAPASANDGCEGDHTAGSSRLTVVVTGIRPVKGQVAITVYPNDGRRFLARGGKLARVRAKAEAVTRACFWLAPDRYAVAVYHDANGDQDFNRTIVGLPAEGFGFSNDPDTKIGLPALSAVRFALPPGEKTITIPIHYLR